MHYTELFETGLMRHTPLLIQVTAGCTHHSCKFCTFMKTLPFKFRMSPLEEVKSDLKRSQLLL